MNFYWLGSNIAFACQCCRSLYFTGTKTRNLDMYVLCMHTCCTTAYTRTHECTHIHTYKQAIPCQKSLHCCSHMTVGRRPQQPKPLEWQPYLPQTVATSTRIVNNMWVTAVGTLLLRTNKISVKSHLQTAAKYKCTFAIRALGVLTSWKITEGNWKKGLCLMLLWRSWRGCAHKYSRMWAKISWALSRGMCT